MSSFLPLLAVCCSLFGLAFAFLKSRWILSQDPGSEKMQEIGAAIREGAMAFLRCEYKVLTVFVLVVAVLLGVSNQGALRLVAVSFVVGALCSGLAGYIGMRIATASNTRTAEGARKGLNQGLQIAFSGGVVMGLTVVGLGLLGLSLLFFLYTRALGSGMTELKTQVLPILNGFALGASSIALFARVGGGIFTKAADVGADLVGKVEAGIPEDDPRNPATIADNVGDNVGDVAGMGADLFESYVGCLLGAMVLGAASGEINRVLLPLLLASVGVVLSVAGTFLVRTREGGNPQHALNLGTFGTNAAMLALTAPICYWLLPEVWVNLFMSTAGGLIAGVAIGIITEYYTSDARSPVQGIAKSCQTGAATNIISGLGVGMASTALPVLFIVAGIICANAFAGLYGIAIGALGMLVTTGIQLAVDAYGPIADNAGGIAEMSEMAPEVRERTDKLDAVGNTTAAIGKGFAIGSAALTALALFAAFRATVGLDTISITDPLVMVGLFIGAMLPYLFSSMAMAAVGRAAFAMIGEVRRQFKEIPGLLEGSGKADYARCVDISTQAAIREMVLPALLGVVTPVLVGFFGGAEMLGGLLAGVTVSGVMLALFMSNAGGAWDNAKKYIEGGHFGGKGSDAHHAAVIGDTVGDPFKDTAGPSLNILIKLMSVVALVIAPML
ncbi:MAG: sodium-translocating pyrophosphatase [Kiritimatiellia bacterium]